MLAVGLVRNGTRLEGVAVMDLNREDWGPDLGIDFDDLADALPAKLSADDAYAIAARRHGVTVAELRGRTRTPHLHKARVEAWRMLLDQGWSSVAVGRAVGRDHSTVLCAVKGLKS